MGLFNKNKQPKLTFEAVNQGFENAFDDVRGVEGQVNQRIDSWGMQHSNLRREFDELRDEIATNGVVRDLRKLEKVVNGVLEQQERMFNLFDEMNTNGVATAVNQLREEVFGTSKEEKTNGLSRIAYAMAGLEIGQEPTLAGKVDAIIEHLGIEVSVKPKEVIPAKVVTKKAKKGRK